MSTNDTKQYIWTDEYGVMRVGETKVSLESVVYPFQNGHSAECIRQMYPALSLEEVYGAITYYLANRDLVHAYLKRQEEHWAELKRQLDANPSPVVERLRALKAAGAKQP